MQWTITQIIIQYNGLAINSTCDRGELREGRCHRRRQW